MEEFLGIAFMGTSLEGGGGHASWVGGGQQLAYGRRQAMAWVAGLEQGGRVLAFGDSSQADASFMEDLADSMYGGHVIIAVWHGCNCSRHEPSTIWNICM